MVFPIVLNRRYCAVHADGIALQFVHAHQPLAQLALYVPFRLDFYFARAVYLSDPVRECTCTVATITRYQKRISGPLLDRIDYCRKALH
jgi:hypothetical protein